MRKSVITVSVHMDYKTLREFSLFDTFVLKKHWLRPAVFGAIFLIFAVVCFAAAGKEQNWLLGTVMLLIGLGMPAVYVGMFLSQVKSQAKKLRLPRKVYTLTFTNEYVRIFNNMKQEDQVTLEWPKIPAAFRRKKAIYLYAAPTRAFILPDGQADASADELWAMMEKHLRKGRARNRR
jgi:hypothetical protein